MEARVTERSFRYRLRRTALWWGLPFTALELIAAPWRLWPGLLLLAVPVFVAATLTGLFVDSAVAGIWKRNP